MGNIQFLLLMVVDNTQAYKFLKLYHHTHAYRQKRVIEKYSIHRRYDRKLRLFFHVKEITINWNVLKLIMLVDIYNNIFIFAK